MDSRTDRSTVEGIYHFPSAPYGLAHELNSTWIDHFQVTPDNDVHYIWIGYSATPRPTTFPRKYILCGTLYLDSNIDDLALDSARLVALILVNLTMPQSRVQQDPTFVKNVLQFVDDQAASPDTWNDTSWEIDGESVAASQWSFAGGTAAFAIQENEKAVLAVSEGVELNSLTINTINDLKSFGIDIARGIRFSDLQRGPGSMAPARTTYHTDHERFR